MRIAALQICTSSETDHNVTPLNGHGVTFDRRAANSQWLIERRRELSASKSVAFAAVAYASGAGTSG